MELDLDFISCGITPRPGCLGVVEELSLLVYSSCNFALLGSFDARTHEFSLRHVFTGFNYIITCLSIHYQSYSPKGVIFVFGDSNGHIYFQLIEGYEMKELTPHSSLVHSMCYVKHLKTSVEWIDLKVIKGEIYIFCGSFEDTLCYSVSEEMINLYKRFSSEQVTLSCSVIDFIDNTFILFGTQSGKLIITIEKEYKFEPVQEFQCSNSWLRKVVTSEVFDCGTTCMVAVGDADGRIEFYKFKSNSYVDSLHPIYWSYANYNVYKEGSIQGHEFGHIYDMGWFRNLDCREHPLMLYTTGDDRTVILWKNHVSSSGQSSWTDHIRFGVLDSTTRYGFFGCKHLNGFFITYAGNGSVYCWKYSFSTYQLYYLTTGHTNSVNCIQWLNQQGMMFVTCGDDFTTRIYEKTKRFGWIEISRPQIHGFEINSVYMGNDLRLFSAAAEKMIRVFTPTLNFYKIANCLGTDRRLYEKRPSNRIPISGCLRRLGLSNQVGQDNEGKDTVEEDVIKDLNYPLNEEQLSSKTLWPEEDKLYGHSEQIITIAGNERLHHLATATMANNEEAAKILIWKMEDGKLIHKLSSHRLTVNHLCYSKDGNHLLSVSRDRTWIIHKIIDDRYIPIISQEQLLPEMKHSRVILSADWSFNSRIFATGGKDNFIIFWSLTETSLFKFLCKYELKSAVTSIAFSKTQFLCAAGTETGEIELFQKLNSWKRVLKLSSQICPTFPIKQLEWNYDKNYPMLAVASQDNSIRLYSVNDEYVT